MTDNIEDTMTLLDAARQIAKQPQGAIERLCDAVALGCWENDIDPKSVVPRIQESFETLN